MAIKKGNIISALIVLLLVILNNQVKAQIITIQSLDGKSQAINVVHDADRDILTVAYLKDTMHINDCSLVEEVTLLNNCFVKIIYQSRGGSGIHLKRMMILTARNNRLYQSLHVTSLFNEGFIDYSKNPASVIPDRSNLYEIKIKLLNTGYKNQKMIVSIHHQEKLKDHPQGGYNKESNVTLSFDTIRNVFYSRHAETSHVFSLYDAKTQQKSKRYLKGKFPLINLGKYNYYYIKDEWYEKGGEDNLLRYSYK